MFSVTIHIKENSVSGEELLKIGKLNLVRCILVLQNQHFDLQFNRDIGNIVFY